MADSSLCDKSTFRWSLDAYEKICDLMVNLLKFTFNKNILNKVLTLGYN